MRIRGVSLLAASLAAALAATAACSKSSAPTVETKARTKSTNSDGTRATTTTESKQFGSTLVSKTERTDDTGKRKEKSLQETVGWAHGDLALVNVILTGDGSKHDYDLADKKTQASVDRRVTVGTKVELDLARDDSGNRSIRVVPAA